MTDAKFNKFMPDNTTKIRFKKFLTYPEDYTDEKCFRILEDIPSNFSLISASTISTTQNKAYLFKPNTVYMIPGKIFTGVEDVPYIVEMAFVEKGTNFVLARFGSDNTAYRFTNLYRAPDQTLWVTNDMLTTTNVCTYAYIEKSNCTYSRTRDMIDPTTGQLIKIIVNEPGCQKMVWTWSC
jgi:hypothetical protein